MTRDEQWQVIIHQLETRRAELTVIMRQDSGADTKEWNAARKEYLNLGRVMRHIEFDLSKDATVDPLVWKLTFGGVQ